MQTALRGKNNTLIFEHAFPRRSCRTIEPVAIPRIWTSGRCQPNARCHSSAGPPPIAQTIAQPTVLDVGVERRDGEAGLAVLPLPLDNPPQQLAELRDVAAERRITPARPTQENVHGDFILGGDLVKP